MIKVTKKDAGFEELYFLTMRKAYRERYSTDKDLPIIVVGSNYWYTTIHNVCVKWINNPVCPVYIEPVMYEIIKATKSEIILNETEAEIYHVHKNIPLMDELRKARNKEEIFSLHRRPERAFCEIYNKYEALFSLPQFLDFFAYVREYRKSSVGEQEYSIFQSIDNIYQVISAPLAIKD